MLPQGASATPLRFPAPHRIPFGPLVNFGYEGEALSPRPSPCRRIARPGSSLPIEARASWLVCERVCIPEEATFRSSSFDRGEPQPSTAVRPLFVAAEAAERGRHRGPRASQHEGRAASIELTGDGLGPTAVREAFFFPLTEGLIETPRRSGSTRKRARSVSRSRAATPQGPVRRRGRRLDRRRRRRPQRLPGLDRGRTGRSRTSHARGDHGARRALDGDRLGLPRRVISTHACVSRSSP